MRIWGWPKRMTGFGARTAFSRMEREILKKGRGVLREPKAVRFKFIEEHQSTFSIGRMCHVMDVSPRGLRCVRSATALPAAGQRSDLVTLAHIKEQSRLSLGQLRSAHE